MSLMLATEQVPAFLRNRGLSEIGDSHWRVAQLTGGVSGAVFSASDGANAFVVKQSLEKLAVPDDWSAPRERILNEARVITMIGDIVPEHSPRLLDTDPTTLTITMEHAPSDWRDWKSELLAGYVDVSLAHDLGTALGSIHASTANSEWSLPPDDGADGFFALRIDPFHRAVAKNVPDVADKVLEVAERVTSCRECLVHGDFSPKNILVAPTGIGDRGFWIIDDEVGHRGCPTFDLAFFLSHLALKRIREQDAATKDRYSQAATAFLAGYAIDGFQFDMADLVQQMGCLMLARVAGRSRVSYLNDDQKLQAQNQGIALLLKPEAYNLNHDFAATSTEA